MNSYAKFRYGCWNGVDRVTLLELNISITYSNSHISEASFLVHNLFAFIAIGMLKYILLEVFTCCSFNITNTIYDKTEQQISKDLEMLHIKIKENCTHRSPFARLSQRSKPILMSF